MTDYVFLVLGLFLLLAGGDALVRGAVGLAKKFEIPPLIIGLTIVSFGTSAPELFISVEAAWLGAGGIAIGNIVGSNIANVMLVLGLPALVRPILCNEDGITKSILIMLGITAVFMVMLSDGALSRLDGLVLFALLILFLWHQYREALSSRNGHNEDIDFQEEVGSYPQDGKLIAGLVIAGLIALPVGASLTIDASTSIARFWGVPDEIIGLTIVAIGTSLPELATTLMSVIRGSASVAIGNIVGSNIFNILAIMGITGIVAPFAIADHIIHFDMWAMLISSVLLGILAFLKMKIGKRVGSFILAIYVAYVFFVFVS